MLNTQFSPWPSFTEEEVEAVARVLRSNKVNYWTGTECRAFENEFSDWTGTSYAIALANGTVALDLALKALRIGPGDDVIVTPRTFVASASSIVNAGATPVFADVDAESGNITASTIEAVLSPKTKAIVCVHLAGWPCDMDPIKTLARNEGIYLIEDCAQAHGALYKGTSVGSIGEIGTWSFCQDKIMTTGGEGGMVTTNDERLWRSMWAYKDHGKSYAAVYDREHPPGFRWLHESFGTNWRMTEMQAAIGRIQLRRMKDWTNQRQHSAEKIVSALKALSQEDGPIRIPQLGIIDGKEDNADSASVHAYYKLYIYIRPENLRPKWNRDRIVDAINSKGVPCYQGICSEVYLEKTFATNKLHPLKRLPIAKELGETSLMFLVHPTLTEKEIYRCIEVIMEVLQLAWKED